MTDASAPKSEDFLSAPLRVVDPEIARLIEAEKMRSVSTLSMVASENLAPRAVLEAQGSVLTNKYADGYPGAREYDGCEFVDAIEELAIQRAKALFGAQHANVQAYSGASANASVLFALCEPGDVVLGFDFEHGGHPTHYAVGTFAGTYYRGINYHVRADDHLVDMDEVAMLAKLHRPRVIFAGWSCYPRFLDFQGFRDIADDVGAYLVVDMAHFSGLVAARLHPSPVGLADVCTMTVHKTLGGPRGGAILCRGELAERIDDAVYPGTQGCPLMHVVAAKAVSFGLCATPGFVERMERTVRGARIVARALLEAEESTNIEVLTGGTDVHQIILDTKGADVDAVGALERLHRVSINANAMRIGHDARPFPLMSGLRLGTVSLATRGFDNDAFVELGAILCGALVTDDDRRCDGLAGRTAVLASEFPGYVGDF